MASASPKVGHGPCPQKGCNAEAYFSRSTSGKLKYECTRCDSGGFCDPGGSAYVTNMAGIEAANPKPAPSPADPTAVLTAVPADPPVKKASGLLLD